MLLSEFLRDLSLGPLADLIAFGAGDGTILEPQRPKVLVRLNDALRDLYRRFPLQLKTLIVEAVDGVHQYPLRREHAQTSDSSQVNKFIKDSLADPFQEDVLGIEHVYDAKHCELSLNDRHDPLSLHTPAFDVLEIGYPVTGERYLVEYRAAHAPIDVMTSAPAEISVRIPTTLINALKLRVAAGVHEGAGSEGAAAKAAAYLELYEAECTRLELANQLQSSTVDTNTKFERGGWV